MRGRPYTCCFTGHRPEKLPWGDDETDGRCAALKKKLQDAVEAAYDEGMRHFICGMARGCDLYFAEAVLDLRERLPGITLECARPCESQADRWPREERGRYQAILERCNYETLVQRHYDRFCMMRRNRYMVDNSSVVIAAFNGSSGGTLNTILYAMRKKREVIQISIESEEHL